MNIVSQTDEKRNDNGRVTFADVDQLVSEALISPRPPVDQNGPKLGRMWQIFTLSDAYQERQPLKYYVDGVFHEASLNLVFGAPGSLKSMLLADMAASVAIGKTWLSPLPTVESQGGRSFQTVQTSVLWVDYDNGRRRTHERFSAIGKGHGLPENAPIHYVSMGTPWLDMSLNNGEELDQRALRAGAVALMELIQARSYMLVIVDNLGLISGDADENSGDMKTVMGNLRNIADLTSAAIIVVHHQRKGGAGSGRSSDAMRGSSSIEASLDLALWVERTDKSTVTIMATKERGAEVPTFGAQFTYQHKPGTHDLETARFWSAKIETAEDKEDRVIAGMILDVLKDSTEAGYPQLKQGTIVDRVSDHPDMALMGKKPGVNRVRSIISQMVSDGKLTEEPGKQRAILYRIAECQE